METTKTKHHYKHHFHHDPNSTGWMVPYGGIGGFIAGIPFAIFLIIMAAILSGPEGALNPFRLLGAIVLGPQSLSHSYAYGSVVVVAGFIVHFVVDVVFGIIFGLIAATFPQITRTAKRLILSTCIYGLILWILNFYFIAPQNGWTWLPGQTNPIVEFFAHTVFFGAALGLYLHHAQKLI